MPPPPVPMKKKASVKKTGSIQNAGGPPVPKKASIKKTGSIQNAGGPHVPKKKASDKKTGGVEKPPAAVHDDSVIII